MTEQIIKTISKMDLKELAPVFTHLAQRVYAHRRGNNGYVPREIFPFCVGIGGIYPCVEVVVGVFRAGNFLGYALKKREGEQEQGWRDKYQIPGVAGRTTDNQGRIFARLSEEIFGEVQTPHIPLDSITECLGCEIHDEPERLAVCWTLVYIFRVQESIVQDFPGVWKIFFNVNDPDIIDHHRATLKWAGDPNRPLLADLRR